MDPNAALRLIQEADIGVQACEDLQQWLRMGGFEPMWFRYPKGAAAFVRWRKRHNITAPQILPEAL